jgi:hypothetical protein
MAESVALPAKRSAAAMTTLVKRTLRLAGIEATRVSTTDCFSTDFDARIWFVSITTADADAPAVLAAAGFRVMDRAAEDIATMGFFAVTAAIAS